ncbi:hypothetical protein P692DRAFT_201872208 [Suillus brevipes Sb2]|nr:hypothetical protein P692DRAFT_201872208 [Suillus brevipes Sb2]
MTEGSFTTCGQAPYDEDEDDEDHIRGQDGLLGSGLVATLLTVIYHAFHIWLPEKTPGHKLSAMNRIIMSSLVKLYSTEYQYPQFHEMMRKLPFITLTNVLPIDPKTLELKATVNGNRLRRMSDLFHHLRAMVNPWVDDSTGLVENCMITRFAKYIESRMIEMRKVIRGCILSETGFSGTARDNQDAKVDYYFNLLSSEVRNKVSRSGNARLHSMTCFTIASISYIAIQPSERKIFITRLNEQLQNLNFLGTVLLGANVGFLAIQSVDSGAGRSPTQIASYMSLVLSFGSIALGLTFITLDLTGRDRGSEASRFLQRMNDGKHGLEAGNDLQPPLRIAYVEHALLHRGVLLRMEMQSPGPSLAPYYLLSVGLSSGAYLWHPISARRGGGSQTSQKRSAQ